MTDLVRQIRDGNLRALARLASAIENRDPQALDTLRQRAPFAGHARIVGITGPPGAGKSTLVDGLAAELRKQGKTVAILAVDPTSRLTGGAILGDRIRMQQHHADSGIFIRSMATRGAMGGLARATAGIARLMDCAGRDYVLIETVGVGQDEVEITSVAHVTVVVLVPGMGDDVQAIKAGIMEIADVFVINKCDRPDADRVERELHAEGFQCPIVRTVATEGKGIGELAAQLAQLTAIRTAPRAAPSACTLDHIGIAVTALDESIAFYRSLGLTVADSQSGLQEDLVAMLGTGENRIELLQPSSPDSAVARLLEKRGPGLHHIALRVAAPGDAVAS